MLRETGSLKETPVMKLLFALFEQGITGVLYLKNNDVLKVLYFSRGKLTWAISNWDEDKLENILWSKKLVDPAAIKKVKKAAGISDSIGKLLVEKGLITLEELIDSSKEQLRRIITSILKWTDGDFQLIKELPPEQLLSLDLNITDFIIDYIVEEVDFPAVWKEIGTLQIEFIKNPDEQKLAKYHLSDKQMKLLHSFDGENKLESILSRHYGGHRESMLKIIYFFLMSELLIKKEFELSDSSVFDDDKGLDYFEPGGPVDIETKKEDPYVFAGESGTGTYKLYEDEPGSRRKGDQRLVIAPVRLHREMETPGIPGNEEMSKENSKRIKLLYVLFVLVFLILVIGGIILLLLPWMADDTPGAAFVNAAKETRQVQIKKPEEKQRERKIYKETPDREPGTLKAGLNHSSAESAVKYFRQGDLVNAGVEWKKEVEKTGLKFSILLELDCLEESVMHAYNKLEMKKEFFLLNRNVGGKTCFLVLWGKFYSRQDAAAALKSIPNYFWKQRDPPEIVELSVYL